MKTERLELRLELQLKRDIDEWRGRQEVPPTRAAAIRYLLIYGLRDAPRPQQLRAK